jgi:DNA-binding transcriptional regulator PaaX
LTKKGERELEKIGDVITKPKKWDGKWRILIFDITETKKSTRDNIRRTLINIGFIKLQNSVWVFPYDCEDLITLLKVDLMVGKEMLYIIADKIENDSILKGRFGLY